MTGLELSRAYWETYGRDMLEKDFPGTANYIAVGLCGSGSECLGFDDEISRDHDFEPGFCLFLPGEEIIDRKESFRLERAYMKLPQEFLGFHRARLSPVGGNRHGVIRMEDFLKEKTGTADGRLTVRQWLTVPEQNLLEATCGEIWRDDSGRFTAIRESLAAFPEDIRLRKLSGELLLMKQSGQYNFRRCLEHGETGGALLAVGEFVRAGMHALFLLSSVYMPYYKWSFRALRTLGEKRSLQAGMLEQLLKGNAEPEDLEEREILIAEIADQVVEELQEKNLTDASCGDMEQHAYSVADRIQDAEIRNMHILAGVSRES